MAKKEEDPFGIVADDEGLSVWMKLLVFMSVFLVIAALYVYGSGIDLQYRRPSPSVRADIENLTERTVAMEEAPVADSEPLLPMDVPAGEESEGDEETPGEDTAPAVAEGDEGRAAATRADEEVSPVTRAPDAVFPGAVLKEYRQPPVVKGGVMKNRPDFSKIYLDQRNTPLHRLAYDQAFNDADGAIGISKELGKPWRFFARPFSMDTDAAKVGVVVYGIGLNNRTTLAATNALPPEVTLSVSPYSDDLAGTVSKARQAGHETLLDLPLQAKDYPLSDPGSLGLLANGTIDDNRARLLKVLSRNVPFSGFFSIRGEGFAMSYPSMSFLLEELRRRGLMFVDANAQTAVSDFKGIPYVRPDIVIDADAFRAAIRAKLDYAKELAVKNGSVVIAAAPTPIVIYELKDWIGAAVTLENGLVLAPVSALVRE